MISCKVSKAIQLLRSPRTVHHLLSLRFSGFLLDEGWFESARRKQSLDCDGSPVPWFTYPFNNFLLPRIRPDLQIFEFGGGASTLYLMNNCASVTTVEHDTDWFGQLQQQVNNNVTLLQRSLDDESYVTALSEQERRYDIIAVDGRRRAECAMNAVEYLTDHGVIIWDDSEREEYQPGIALLAEKGFKRLDFWGCGAGFLFKACTTVFYRSDNCLGI